MKATYLWEKIRSELSTYYENKIYNIGVHIDF